MGLELNKWQSKIIKSIAIIFVIMSHTGIFPCGGAIGVNLFLFVSGYGIYCSLEKGVKDFWKKRIFLVYFPYLFCTVLFLIIRMSIYRNITLMNIIFSLLGQDFNLNVDPTMWYISYIFVCYFVAWKIFLIKNKKMSILFGVIAFGIIAACGYKYIIWHRGTIVWNYCFSFPCGMFLAKYRTVNEFKCKKIKIILFIIFSLISAVLLTIPHEKFVKLGFTFSVAFLVYLFITQIKNNGNLILRIFEIIGSYSFFMYLNEALIIGLFKLPGGILYNTILIIFISFICAFVLEKIYSMLIMTYVRKR